MSKTIEEMIKSGCTYEEAMDALQDVWESTEAERMRDIREGEARQNMMTDYRKYLQIVCPNISEKNLEKQVAELETILCTIRNIYTNFTKINDLQLKSKEESNKAEDDIESRVNKLFNRTKAEKAESADKVDKAKLNRLKIDYSLDDFLKEMGW